MGSDKLSRRHFLAGAGATALSTQFTSAEAVDAIDRQGWLEGTVRDASGRPLDAARIQADAMAVTCVPNDVHTPHDGRFRLKLSWRPQPEKSPVLFLTTSKRGYVPQVIPVKLDAHPSVHLEPKLSPSAMYGFPGSDLRFEGIMIDSRTHGSSWDNDLTAHPSVHVIGNEYFMFYTANNRDRRPCIAVARSRDGLTDWQRIGPVLWAKVIDPKNQFKLGTLFSSQFFRHQGINYLLTTSTNPTVSGPILSSNELDPSKSQGWRMVSGKPLTTDLQGWRLTDSRIYIVDNPPSIGGERSKFWMYSLAIPPHGGVVARYRLAFRANHLEGPYKYVKPAMTTPRPSDALYPGGILRVGSRYFWLCSYSDDVPLVFPKGNVSGRMAVSDDLLNWRWLSASPLIKPGLPPSFDDTYVLEFDFLRVAKTDRCRIYYAARSARWGKKVIACYSLRVNSDDFAKL